MAALGEQSSPTAEKAPGEVIPLSTHQTFLSTFAWRGEKGSNSPALAELTVWHTHKQVMRK